MARINGLNAVKALSTDTSIKFVSEYGELFSFKLDDGVNVKTVIYFTVDDSKIDMSEVNKIFTKILSTTKTKNVIETIVELAANNKNFFGSEGDFMINMLFVNNIWKEEESTRQTSSYSIFIGDGIKNIRYFEILSAAFNKIDKIEKLTTEDLLDFAACLSEIYINNPSYIDDNSLDVVNFKKKVSSLGYFEKVVKASIKEEPVNTSTKDDANNSDTDGDSLSDGDEVNKYKTEPLKADTDGGGLKDAEEVAKNKNPFNPSDDIDKPKVVLLEVGSSKIKERIII